MNAADILAQTYKDTCDIYRYEPITEGGITRNKEILRYSNVMCALSQGSLAQRTDDSVAVIPASSKVFFMPDTDVQEGDQLVITQASTAKARTYIAGEVFVYAGSHIEVKVSRSDPV